MRDTRAYRRAHGLCTCCGQVKVVDAINCRRCANLRNEKIQQRQWDSRVEHEDYLRGDLKLVTSIEAAEILGIKLQSLYKRVFRGTLLSVYRDTFTWFYRPGLETPGEQHVDG